MEITDEYTEEMIFLRGCKGCSDCGRGGGREGGREEAGEREGRGREGGKEGRRGEGEGEGERGREGVVKKLNTVSCNLHLVLVVAPTL